MVSLAPRAPGAPVLGLAGRKGPDLSNGPETLNVVVVCLRNHAAQLLLRDPAGGEP